MTAIRARKKTEVGGAPISDAQHSRQAFIQGRMWTSLYASWALQIAEEWAELAQDDTLADEEDPELQESINEVTSELMHASKTRCRVQPAS